MSRDGHEGSGIQRLVCRKCGRRHNPLTVTAIEHSKSDLATWTQFVRPVRLDAPLDVAFDSVRYGNSLSTLSTMNGCKTFFSQTPCVPCTNRRS